MPTPRTAAPASASVSIMVMLVWLVAGGAFGVWLARTGVKLGIGGLLWMSIGGIVGAWSQLLIHEAGHALAGLARGMHLFALGLGPLRIEQTRGGWHARWARSIAGIGGFAALSPAAGRTPRRLDQAIFVLGGPLANLLAAVCVLPFAIDATASAAPWSAALWIFVGFGVLLGVINLVPFRSGGWRTDGLTLVQLWRRPGEARAAQQLQALVGLSLAGIRPRDWAEEAIPVSEVGFDPMLSRAIDLMCLSRALDSGLCEVAERLALSIAVDHASAPDGVRQSQALMMASFAARCARSEPLLAAWIPLGEGSLLTMDAHREWLRAELAALRGESSTAREHLALARAALPRVHDAATHAQLSEYLAQLEGSIGTASSATQGVAVHSVEARPS
jgi:hypothetical protein